MRMKGALRIVLRFCRIFFHIHTIFLAVEGEEVAIQDDTDSFQQAGIDTLPLEDIIHIGAVAVQLLCEPRCPPFLAMQFCLNFFSNIISVH